jgi:outer membrane receptor protein involved in Fe transport
MDHYEIRLDFNHLTLSKHSLEYGYEMVINNLNRGIVEPYGLNSLKVPVDLGVEKGIENSIYLSDMVDVLPWLNFSVGVRYSLYAPLGPRKVYAYEDDQPMNDENYTDSMYFNNNQPIKWYSMPEMRASINFKTDANGSVKVAFNQMHQSLFMLNNTLTIAPNTQWKLADYYLVPARGNQISVGIFRNIPEKGLETSVETFFKTTRHYPEFRDGADFLDGSPIESQVLQGKQKSYGIELSLKYSAKKIDGWLAYTYSRALVKIDGGTSWNTVNRGESYPASFDIPHALNALLNYHPGRRIGLSTVLTYQTGRPITYPVSIYYIDGVPYTDYSKRNQYNIPDYFRLDASATLEGNLKKKKPFHSSLVFSVYNLTGRKNPYSIYFRPEHGEIHSYKYSVIGVPLITLTWLLKLGNYASE